jgi:hypothetical protein
VYRERQFLRLCRHIRRGKLGENQHWQKEIFVHWEGLFRKITELLQHTWQRNWIFVFKTLFPQKLFDVNFTDPISTRGLQLLNLLLPNVRNAQMRKRCVTTIKPGNQTTGNACIIWSDESSLRLFPTSGRVYVWDHPRKTTIRNAWFKQCNMEDVLWWCGQQYRCILLVHYYPSWPNNCKGVRGQVG